MPRAVPILFPDGIWIDNSSRVLKFSCQRSLRLSIIVREANKKGCKNGRSIRKSNSQKWEKRWVILFPVVIELAVTIGHGQRHSSKALIEKKLNKKYSVGDVLMHLLEIKKINIKDEWRISEINTKTIDLLKKLGINIT
jgi:hypothetical protein